MDNWESRMQEFWAQADDRFQDLSEDTNGTFEERLRPPEGSQWQMNTLALSCGANCLLAAEDRNEFKSRNEPFRGLIPPEPLES